MPRADYETPFATVVAHVAAEALRPGTDGETPSAKLVARLFDLVATSAGQLAARMARTQPPPRPLACRKGCAFCCSWPEVLATPPEVVRIVAHVAATFPESEAARLKEAVRAVNREKDAAGTPEAEEPRRSFPCPLLVDGACSVYAVRPFACRGMTAYRAEDCEARTAPIEGYAHAQKIAQAAIDGLRQGIARRGLADAVLDLSRALEIALDQPQAGARWAAGERVFEPAASRTKAPGGSAT